MLVQAARRLALIFGAVLGRRSSRRFLGFAAGANIGRSVAIGLYVAGAVALLGCFVMGPPAGFVWTGSAGETTAVLGARRVRRATPTNAPRRLARPSFCSPWG
jgi:hypothetical protein